MFSLSSSRVGTPPPINIAASLRDGQVIITWKSPDDTLLGYNVYQNGNKVAFLPRISSHFEFPFSNESTNEKMLIFSSITNLSYSAVIPPFTKTRFDVSSVSGNGESALVGLTVTYEHFFEFTDALIEPNPVDVMGEYVLSAAIRDEENLVIN